MTTFQIVLPQIEVATLDGTYMLESLVSDMKAYFTEYVLDGIDLSARLAEGYSLVIKRDQGIFLVPADPSQSEIQLTAYYNVYWLRSTNDKRTISTDSDVCEGFFQSVPEALLKPTYGEKVRERWTGED